MEIGQRWVSDHEPELGLGIIDKITIKIVRVYFPATDSSRQYSKVNSTISRFVFSIGDTIENNCNKKIKIEKIHGNESSVITYLGSSKHGIVEKIVESEINPIILLDNLQSKKKLSIIEQKNNLYLKLTILNEVRKQRCNSLMGLTGSRTALIPHQLFITNEVCSRESVNILLSDEVGLGKTIEAGLILKKKLTDNLIDRVLIIVPESLQFQWIIELLRKFDLQFSLFDKERYIEELKNNKNPFDGSQLIISSIELLKSNSNYQIDIEQANFDMIIIDEAHHITFEQNKITPDFAFIKRLCEKIKNKILITATPYQFGSESHFGRLSLLDPKQFNSYEEFQTDESNYKKIIPIIKKIHLNQKISKKNLNSFSKNFCDGEQLKLLTSLSNTDNKSQKYNNIKRTLINNLIDRHGTSRLIFRNTRSLIKGFPTRKTYFKKLKLPNTYKDVYDNLKNITSFKHDSIISPELLISSPNGWCKVDPRITWIEELLSQDKRRKFLLICSNALTAQNIGLHLKRETSLKISLFVESLSIIERDRAAAYFAEPNGSQLLICSEIGSEGRNFQFTNNLILFDLPVNPDLLEQRIGRLDRIGQKSNQLNIFIPYFTCSPQERLLNWYVKALNAFHDYLSSSYKVFKQFEKDLFFSLVNYKNIELSNILIKKTKVYREKLIKEIEKSRDYLIEINSSGQDYGIELKDRINEEEKNNLIKYYAEQVFDKIGILLEEIDETIYKVSLSESRLFESFPGIPDKGKFVTFNRKTAIENEHLTFLTWSSNIIQNAIFTYLSANSYNISVLSTKNSDYKHGNFFIEFLFISNPQVSKKSNINSYFPTMPIRVLISEDMHDISNMLSAKDISENSKLLDKKLSLKIFKFISKHLSKIEYFAQKTADEIHQKEKNISINRMHKIHEVKRNRLLYLMNINPNISEEEVVSLDKEFEENKKLILQTEIYLDTMHIIVNDIN